mgnify:CR=1 FL=1
MEELKELIRLYMNRYGLTQWEAIQAIETDLRDITETPV